MNISIRGRWYAVLLALCVGLLALPALASVQEIRVVGVGVESSSLKAEALALDYAKKRAIFLVARKLGVADASIKVAKFSDDQLGEILRGANVVNERRDGEVTYLDVQVTVVEEPLLRALKLPDDYGKTAPTTTVLRSVLLLPVMVGKDRAYLWEKENQLRPLVADELRRQAQGAGVLLPGGDFDDSRLIDHQNALTVKPDELKPMFARYGAEEIIIAVLKLSEAGTEDASNVLLRRLRLSGGRDEIIDIPPGSADETVKVRLAKAANAIAGAVTEIATSTAEYDQRLREQAKKLPVRFAYAIPRDLARMQEAVRHAPQVLYLDLPSIALAQVKGTLYLKGEGDALRETLTKQGLIVTPAGEGWIISVR